MTVEERMAALEAKLVSLEKELAEAQLTAAKQASIIAENKNMIVNNQKQIQTNTESIMNMTANAYTQEPDMTPEEMLEAQSYNASAAEIQEDMKAAGIEVPEKEEKAEGEGIMSKMSEHMAETYACQIKSFVDPTIGADAPAPEKDVDENAVSAETQLANDYVAVPDLNPIEELMMEAFAGSPAKVKEEIKDLGEE